MAEIIKLALCQIKVADDKDTNIYKALEMIENSAKNEADIVILPEMFNCPYENRKFRDYAEHLDNGKTIKSVSNAAKKYGVHIIAGSIPEISDGKIYNTCVALDNKGEVIGIHRKVHLFDINVPGKITFRESDTLSAGNDITVVDAGFCKIGIAICYDVRFPELFRLMTLKGAQIIAVPAAFNMTTGPAHWELLMRTRALDNQVFIAAASPARDENAAYVAYGNSVVVDPWANVLAKADEKENIVYSDIDLSILTRVRNELPLLKHRRGDLYEISKK